MADINTNPVSVTTPTVDTSSWNTPSMAPSFVSMQQPTSFTPDPAMPKVADRSAEINAFIGSIRYDAMSSIGQKSKKSEWLSAIDPSQGKMQTTSQVALTDTHELLNDGETWMPKYKSYLEGVDNDTRLSNQQSDWEKFSNPIKRFGSNTSKGVLDIGSFVYGIGAAAVSGRFDALYDNAMSRYVDDFTAQTNFKYKNYYDQATKDKSLGLDLQTWDKVLGGAEFTARMFASEAVIALASGGTSVPASFARAGYKAGMALDKASDIAKTIATGKKISKMTTMATAPERMTAEASNIAKGYERVLNANKEAISKGKWGDRLVQARFAVTSPMYEAGFEAMHFRKEAEQNFYDYYKRNGIEPTTEDINAFSEKLSGASNAVFGANMAILSVSNLALFGDLLSVKNPLAKSVFSPSQFFKKNVFKSTTEKVAETGLYQASKAGILNKTAAYLSPIVKGMVIEGVYEEGSQGIASGTLKNYVASAYDSEAMKNTANYVDSFGKAFGDQFSTKEGQEEIIIGAIIGGLFGGVGGVKSQAREYSQQKDIAKLQNKGQEFVDTFKSNSYTNEQLLSLFSGANRFQKLRDELEKAELQDDNLKQAAIKAQSFISLLDSYHSVGKEGEFIQMFESMFKGMDNKSIAEATGLDLSEIDGFKQSQIQGMNDISKAYSTAREAGRYLFRPNTGGFTEAEIDGKKVRVNSESMASSYAFASTMGFFNNKFAVETFDAFQTKLAELNGSPELIEKLGAVTVLKRLGALESANYSKLAGEENKLRLKLGQITKKVNLLSQGEDKTEYARQALELSQQLADTQSELTRVSAKKDSLWKSAVDNFYSEMGKTGYATQLDLENFESQVQDIQDSLDGLNIKPEDKIILENLMEQFNKSNTAYKSFTDLTNKLADPKFAFKTYRGILSGTRAKMDVSLNEHTKDAMLKIYNYDRNPYGVDEDLIEKPEVKAKTPVDDPLTSEDPLTNIDNLGIQKRSLDKQLTDLENGEYSEELHKKIDKIKSKIQDIKNQIEELKPRDVADVDTSAQDLEISRLEKEIEVLEQSGKVDQVRVQQGLDVRKQNYTQYEYTTPKGDVLLGWLETRTNGKIFFVTEDGYFNYIGEARSTTIANLKNLRAIQEEDIIIEGKEIYVNGKIYKLGLKNPTLDKSISKDKSGNYQVTLQARNGRMVTLTGNVADTIVYQHLLNKLEQDATEQQIRELREQADRDAKIERKYEELISKTEDRDSRISQVEQERYDSEKEFNSKRSELESQIQKQEIKIESEIQSEKIRIENDIASVNGEISTKEKIERLENEVKVLREEIILEINEEVLEDEISYYSSLNDSDFESELKQDLNSIQEMKTWDKIKSLNPFDTVKYKLAGLTYYTDSIADAIDMINDYYKNIERKSPDLESNQINIDKIQRLLLLEKELKDLKSQKEEFNPNGTPLEQLEWVVKNVPALNFGSADGLSDLKNPSQSDVDEYVELTKTRNRNSQQKKRTAELRDKLLPFNLAQGLDIDGLNIIDIINLYNQSKNKQEVQNTQENQITEDDFKQNNQVAQGKPEFRSPNTGLVYDGAYIERSDGIEKVFHIKLTTFLTKALEKGNKPRIVIMHKSGRSNEVPEQVIQVDASNVSQLGEMFDKVDNIKVDLNDDGLFLKKPTGQTSFHVYGQGLLPLIDSEAYYIKGQSTGYVLIYNQKSDGSFGARESEFFVSRDGVIIPFDKKELNSIKPGDTVTMEFDPLDDYNKTLPKKDYKTKGNIYVKKNGKLVQILKATNDVKKSDKDAWSDLEATRKKVVESKTPVTITVQKSYLGLPIVEVSSDLSVKENLVDDSKVVAYGYIDLNGELQGDIKSTKLDNTQYIEPLEKSGKIIPVMAIKTNGMTIGVPLNLKPKGVDLSQDVDNIMNAELSREQKMFQINDLLEQNQMFTEDLAVDATNFDVNKVKTALEQVYSKIDVTDPIQFENADKYSYIDLRDPFMSSKLVFEFEKPDDQILDVGDSVKDLVIQLLNTADMKGADASNNNYC